MADDHLVNSYRYLRLALVVVTVTLGISLILEVFAARCYQGSISAFYYTPVHSILVGVLFVIGVSLVALIGRDRVEDLFFNLAGFLAPVVALVPTARPADLCGPEERHLAISDSTLLVTNNAWSLFLGFLLALLVASWLARGPDSPTAQLSQIPRATRVGIGLSLLVLVIGLVWFLTRPENFGRRAHGTAAVLMFVAIWLAVLVNADFERLRPIVDRPYQWLQATRPTFLPDSRHDTYYRPRYKAIAVFMALAGIVLGIGVATGVSHAVFWLEVAEIVPFAYFWALQTGEGWSTGTTSSAAVPVGPNPNPVP